MLTAVQLQARSVARRYATARGVRVVERGTRVGLCGHRESPPADLPTISLTASGFQLR